MQIKKYLISALCLLVGLSVSAQSNTIVEVNYDRKVIYTDSLALPRSINVGALLRLLPELLARPGDNTLSNYEVQIDGVSVGEAADDVLSIVQLEDVKRLEVNNSPTMSDLNNGQSGSINIWLRPLASKPQGVSGTASLGASTEMSLTQNLLIDYHGKKFSVRAMGFGEYFNQSPKSWQEGPVGWTRHDKEKFWQQTARASVYYQPNKHNDFTFTLSEGTHYDYLKHDIAFDGDAVDYDNEAIRERERGARLMSQLNYSHTFSSTRKLSASVKYSHNPLWTYSLQDESEPEDMRAKFKNDWQARLTLADRLRFAQGRGSLAYRVGMKGSVKHTDNYSDTYSLDQKQHTASDSDIRGLMPLAELTMVYGPLSMKLGAEYQWNSQENDDNWTGRLSMIWQMNHSNRLRVALNRQLRYPDILAHLLGIDYIGGFRWGGHALTSNVGASLCSISVPQGDDLYYVGNVMGVYQYDKHFFLSLTANYYRRLQSGNDGKDGYHTYYNLSLMPSVIFGDGWRVAANVRFFSHVLAEGSHNNANAIWQVNGGKSWGAWNVYVYARRPMRKWNVINDYETSTAFYSQMIQASVGAGLSYRY